MPGSTIVACWTSGVAGSGIVLSACPHLVSGDTWVRKVRRRSSWKSKSACSLRPVLSNPSKDISCFSPVTVGG